MMDVRVAQEIFKHFYGGQHRPYPYCPECVKQDVRALKARLIEKYRRPK